MKTIALTSDCFDFWVIFGNLSAMADELINHFFGAKSGFNYLFASGILASIHSINRNPSKSSIYHHRFLYVSSNIITLDYPPEKIDEVIFAKKSLTSLLPL